MFTRTLLAAAALVIVSSISAFAGDYVTIKQTAEKDGEKCTRSVEFEAYSDGAMTAMFPTSFPIPCEYARNSSPYNVDFPEDGKEHTVKGTAGYVKHGEACYYEHKVAMFSDGEKVGNLYNNVVISECPKNPAFMFTFDIDMRF